MSFFHTYEFQSSFGHRKRGCVPLDRRGNKLDITISHAFEDPGLNDHPIDRVRLDKQVAQDLRESGRTYVVVRKYQDVDLGDEQIHNVRETLWEAEDLIEHLEAE